MKGLVMAIGHHRGNDVKNIERPAHTTQTYGTDNDNDCQQ